MRAGSPLAGVGGLWAASTAVREGPLVRRNVLIGHFWTRPETQPARTKQPSRDVRLGCSFRLFRRLRRVRDSNS